MSKIKGNARKETLLKAIETLSLTKKFGAICAADNLDVSVEQGEIFTFLGANGAGKTTIINLLSTLIDPSSGSAKVLGLDLMDDKHIIRSQIAMLPQGAALDPFLSVYDNLKFYYKLSREKGNRWTEEAEELLDALELSAKKNKSVISLSGGQSRRAQIARILLSKAPLVFLDEPTLGIDIEGKLKIWELIKKWQRINNCTVILSTNDMEEAEWLSDRILFLKQGCAVGMGTPEEFKAQSEYKILKIKYGEEIAIPDRLAGFKLRSTNNNSIMVYIDKNIEDISSIFSAANQLGRILEINLEKPSLSEIFLQFQEGKL
jgi:ABC-2 type transport system ATP-binding protein